MMFSGIVSYSMDFSTVRPSVPVSREYDSYNPKTHKNPHPLLRAMVRRPHI
jgi:hypothetical protein